MRKEKINKRNQIDRVLAKIQEVRFCAHLRTVMAAPFFTFASSKIGLYMFLFFKEAFALGDCQALLEAALIQMSWMEYRSVIYTKNQCFPTLINIQFPIIFTISTFQLSSLSQVGQLCYDLPHCLTKCLNQSLSICLTKPLLFSCHLFLRCDVMIFYLVSFKT